MSYVPPPRVRPSGAAYLIPAFVWLAFSVVAFVAGGAQLINGLSDAVNDLERVPAATGGSVDLDEGKNWLYYDNNLSSSSSATFDPGIDVTIIGPDGNEVPLKDFDGTTIDYSTDDGSGVSFGQFDAPSDGTYQIQVAEGSSTSPDAEILVGGNVLAGVKTGAIIFFSVGTFGFVLALIIFIVIARKRGKSKRQMQQGYGGGGGWPGGQGGYGAPAAYPTQSGYGAPVSYPPADGGYPPPPGNYPPPGEYGPPGSAPPQGGGYPPSGGGYQPPAGGYPPSGS